eukprot:Gb_14283 [translate_table: standard]
MAQESWKNVEEETSRQPPEGPVLCTNNCGFFGSSATMNMCSKCYTDVVLLQKQASSVKTAVEKSLALGPATERSQFRIFGGVSLDEGPASSSSSSVADSSPACVVQEPQQVPNRCFSCRKRVGLTGFKCRCGYTFCSLHRYSEKHDCSFDYKSAGRQAIAKANPVVKAEKIQKI